MTSQTKHFIKQHHLHYSLFW